MFIFPDTVFALVYLRGEGAEEKALKLSGSDMGGHKVVAKPCPFNATDLDPVLSLTRDSDNSRQFMMGVTGFDISLHAPHVEHALLVHFSQCGRVLSACAPPADIEECEGVLDSIATVTLEGQAAVEKALQLCGCDVVEKALQLCGCDVKGLGFFQVTGVCPPPKRTLPIMTPPWMWTDGSLMIRRPDMPRMSRRTDGSIVFTPPPRIYMNLILDLLLWARI
ncbi:PREDICTED: nucleolin 1-like [Camelina sativa]|uniref:Nucleolin 1-like n=1 Tax=Camelina sativa TaxID=90675 RepID=A0ABM0YES3_CAMSA|nr:PREDICTED: nucleolin 1-like [Camelina sativa]